MTGPRGDVARDTGNVTYDAFISYSHAADGKLAPAVESALEGFAKPWYRLRALHLFRDQTSLSATPGLWPAIEEALQGSRYFLLLASPEAAQSRWVQQEVAWWLEHKSPQTLLIDLTDGKIVRHPGATDFDWEATDALPPTLQGVFVENPLWVDFRWAKGQEHLSTKNPDFQNALAALAAPLRDIPKENLIGEDVRQHRRALLLARGASVALVLLLIAAIRAAFLAVRNQDLALRSQAEAEAQRDEAQHQTTIALARALAAQAPRQHEIHQDERGALLARQAYLFSQESGAPVLDQADAALRGALGVPHFSVILRGHPRPVIAIAFSPDGRRLASGGRFDNAVRLWDLDHPGAPPAVLAAQEAEGASVPAVEFSPDGRSLAAGGTDGTVRLWDLRHLEAPPAVLAGHEESIASLAFSPDGRILASAGRDGSVRLWDPSRPSAVPAMLGPKEGSVSALAFSPDGRVLAVAGGDVRLWDPARADAAPAVLTADEIRVVAVTFSPDGRILASGSRDRTVRLWDPTRPDAQPAVLAAHEDRVVAVAFSPDGRTLASGSEDGTARVWIARTEILADMVCERVWRNLTLDEWRLFVGDPEQVPYQPICSDLPPGEGVVTATPSLSTSATPTILSGAPASP